MKLMKTEVICNKCGTKLEIRERCQSPLSVGTEDYIERFSVKPCPKYLEREKNEAHKKSYCSPKHGW